MTKKQPINAGGRCHDGKNFDMFQRGTKQLKKGYKPPKKARSGKSYSREFPEGKRRE